MAKFKLTGFSKFLLIAAIIFGLWFVYTKFFGGSLPSLPSTDNTETVDQNNANENSTTTTTTTTNPSSKNTSFKYTPPAPQGGKLYGVVELGSSGFNSFIIKMDGRKNWKLEKAEWGNSLVYDGMASGSDITSGLKRYIGNMLDYGVGGRDIHFVVSSGAMKVKETQTIINGLKGLNYVVNEVTPEKEAQLALKSVLPPSYTNNAFVIDIGSGNTKVSWMEGARIKGFETYGAKYYNNNVADAVAYKDVKNIVSRVPVNKRGTCFIIGGIPYQLAKEVRDGKERYTVLNAPNAYKEEGAKMKAGLNIYRAIIDATGCNQYVFDWDANFTIGFLLDM